MFLGKLSAKGDRLCSSVLQYIIDQQFPLQGYLDWLREMIRNLDNFCQDFFGVSVLQVRRLPSRSSPGANQLLPRHPALCRLTRRDRC